MNLKQIALTVFLFPAALYALPGVSAEEEHEHEHRQHDVHVHGIAALNFVLEGKEVHIEFESPAANIVGFEHAPSTEADYAALDKAVATLKEGNPLFKFNDKAGCRMETAKVVSSLLDEEHDGHEDEHAYEEKNNKEQEHQEDHSDIEVSYHFECTAPDKLKQLTVELFDVFPGTEKLKVQYIIENKQGGLELTAADHVIKF